MGNTLGAFREYWDMIYRYGVLQGGFIWDWVDQGLETQKNGKTIWAFGGDFGAKGTPSDLNFCINGLVQPDRTPSPHLFEAKKVMQPVTFREDIEAGTIEIQNRYDFLSLDHLDFFWQITLNGSVVESGQLQGIQAEAHGSHTINMPKPTIIQEAFGEYHLLVSAYMRETKSCLPKGLEVAWEQWHLLTNAPVPIASITAYSGDEVSLEAAGKFLGVVDGKVVALDAESSFTKIILDIKDPTAPMRIGFTATLIDGFEDVEWFGRGPHESYLDRHASAKEPSPVLEMQCHRYALSDFDGGEDKPTQRFLHSGELEQRPTTALCIDAIQMGVGGIDSWGNKPLADEEVDLVCMKISQLQQSVSVRQEKLEQERKNQVDALLLECQES
eukprot:g18299.t1